ncbi:MAG: LacI family transcriptional regulator [Candidatus Margulisbacteria bacterium]|nr:LacI family transcriptional regulator [Candidatus Margulisiibacteriota bacterium]
MPRKVRIKEIAKKVGCSPATVSQAFNNPKLVNRKTRANILEVCEELGYVRKRFSQRTKKIIGVTGISHELILGEYYNKITTAILSAAKEQGINVIIEHFADEEECLPHMFSKKILDGFLVLGKISQDHVLMIKQQGIPLVLCGHPIPGIELHTVLSDGRAGIYEVTKHLIELGHKRFAYMTGGPLFDPVTSDRLDGFRFALNEAGITFSGDHIAIGDFCNWETANKAVDKLLKLDPQITALVCESDALAYTAYQGLMELGYKIPKDISITGFDNIPFPPYINAIKTKLTTIDVNLEDLGRTAVNTLLDIIENPSRAACRYTLPAQLIKGETTAKA